MSLKFYILGIRRNFRGNDLFNHIQTSGFDVEIIWGIDAELNPPTQFRNDLKSEFFYRRKLSYGEIACTLGHRIIANKAHMDKVDTAIILEDDVSITSLKDLVSCVEILSSRRRSLLLLVVDPRLTLSIRMSNSLNGNGYRRLLSNPSPTSAYAVNKSAISWIVKQDESELKGFQADFPVNWLGKIDFLSSTRAANYVSIAQISSLMTHRGRSFEDNDKIFVRILKLLSPLNLVRAKSYGVTLTAYFSHFVGRSIAWRLQRRTNYL